MAIILDRKNTDTALQEMIEKIKLARGYSSATKAVYEAIRFYIEEKPRLEKRLQALFEEKEQLQTNYYALRQALQKKAHAEQVIKDLLLND